MPEANYCHPEEVYAYCPGCDVCQRQGERRRGIADDSPITDDELEALTSALLDWAIPAGLTDTEIESLAVSGPHTGNHQRLRAELAELSERIHSRVWAGRSGKTDRAVALALVEWAHEVCVWHLDANVRDLAVRAGVGKTTAARALGRLRKIGLCRPVADNDQAPEKAQRWALNVDWEKSRTGTYYSRGSSTVNMSHFVPLRTDQQHPAFLPGALGRTAGLIYFGMPENEEASPADVAGTVGCRTQTARKLMKRLTEHGLLVETRRRPVAYRLADVDPSALDAIADEYGTADWADRSVDRVSRERKGYELKRQEWSEKKSARSAATADGWETVT
ncbi:hypothetical protein [Saccharomonospora sp. CUA-673]|uniref:hypothetical protein n=1 Tax=Saccharomonospora sp. CUA-673 TaxID=1904969 RepID=UPI0011151185|nr:hypothetical protein [Saccharomonospora sp. CUA-673]